MSQVKSGIVLTIIGLALGALTYQVIASPSNFHVHSLTAFWAAVIALLAGTAALAGLGLFRLLVRLNTWLVTKFGEPQSEAN